MVVLAASASATSASSIAQSSAVAIGTTKLTGNCVAAAMASPRCLLWPIIEIHNVFQKV